MNRTKWIVSGAIIGGIFSLWRIIVADAHIVNMVLGIIFGAWIGSTLVEKSIREGGNSLFGGS